MLQQIGLYHDCFPLMKQISACIQKMAGACLSPCGQGQGNEPGAPFQSELVSVILESKDRQYVCCLVDHYKHDCRVYESQIARKVDFFHIINRV